MARVFRTAIWMACFLCAGSAFAAGGACPANPVATGNNCYFIAATGADTNNGTSEATPWLHAPGMPNCANTCATVQSSIGSSAPGIGFILRGGDTWHFGNSALSPYTGGTWTFNMNGTASTCTSEQNASGCVYYGVDSTWYNSAVCGASWCRPKLNGDNPLSASILSSCAFQTGASDTLTQTGDNRTNIYLDSFEMLGLCSQDPFGGSTSNDTYIGIGGTGSYGLGMVFEVNLYIHGWTVTSNAGSSNSAIPCNILGGDGNGLQSIIRLVVDGSDSNPGVCAWAGFPSFYHFKDSMLRYVTQGVGQFCHDIHDNIFEHFYNPAYATHGNVLECKDDSPGNAPNQPQNTPNVFYNNILRHSDPSWHNSGNPQWWFCPQTVPEYWFNNIQYDIETNQNWDIAGPPGYACSNTGGQFMFNNTLVDAAQPCHLQGSNGTGGLYLTVLNEHLINSPIVDGTGCIGGASSATNIFMSDATATSQGYTTGSAGTLQPNTCANDTTTPCVPTSSGNSTVGAGANHQAYCTQLAAYSSEYAIGTEAANACKYGTTDGCAYNSTTHTMNCPAQTPVARSVSGAWNSGAYELSSGPSPAENLSTSASVTSVTAVRRLSSTCTASAQSAADEPLATSGNTASVTANINAVGDLVTFTAWCFTGCTPTSVTMGSQTAVKTTVSGNNDANTGQPFLYYILSTTASGSQTVTFTGTGASQLQVSYQDFTPSAGCGFTHDVDSPLGAGGPGGTSNTPSITPTVGDLLFVFTAVNTHIQSVNSPWGCTIIPGTGVCGVLQHTRNGVGYILSAASGSTANNMTNIHASDFWQGLITSFSIAPSGPAPRPPSNLQVTVQ